jgi:hypothetical protein
MSLPSTSRYGKKAQAARSFAELRPEPSLEHGGVEVEDTLALDERVGADGVVAGGKRRDLDLGAEVGERLGDPALALVDVDDDLDGCGLRSGHERMSRSARRAEQDAPHGRRPPAAASVGGCDAFRGEVSGDLGEASTAGDLDADAIDDARRQCRRPASMTPRRASTRGLEVLSKESLEFRDGYQPLTPRRLDRVHGGNEAAIDGRDADVQRFGCLLAAVCEAVGLVDLVQLTRRRPRTLRLGPVLASLSFSAAFPSRAHQRRTVIPASDSTCGASVSGVPMGGPIRARSWAAAAVVRWRAGLT